MLMLFLEEWFFKMTFLGRPLIKILLTKCWPIQDALTGQMVYVWEIPSLFHSKYVCLWHSLKRP
jgi:hypothetical protein